MFIWRGHGWVAIPIVLVFLWLGFEAQSIAAQQIHPDSRDAVALARITHSWIDLIPGSTWLLSAVVLWFWGSKINREDGGHSVYFIPVQYTALIPAACVIGFGAYYLMSTPIERQRDSFAGSCKQSIVDLNEDECDCVAAELTENLRPESMVAFFRFAGDVRDEPILDSFYENDFWSLSSEGRAEFRAVIDQTFATCLPPMAPQEEMQSAPVKTPVDPG